MIGEYVEGKGWEVLCDNLGLLVGYVNTEHNPLARITRPDDADYEVLCQEVFRIEKVDGVFIFNGNESTPTNTQINYAVQMPTKVVVEVDQVLYNCYTSNTYINGATSSNLTSLYNNYVSLL